MGSYPMRIVEMKQFSLVKRKLSYNKELLKACPRGRIKSGGRKDFEEGR